MANNLFETKEQILKMAKSAEGFAFKKFDVHNRFNKNNKNKGNLGQIIEEGLFGYKINSKSEADFLEAGVELKVTPFKKIKRGYSAKERLVLNIINYMDEYKFSFESSSFWNKNSTLLLMFYEHIKDVPKEDFIIYKSLLYEYPEEDLIIIKQDWEKIISKIRAGKAHEISEGDTLYLGACTKGATAKTSLRSQPFSDIPARQRAYSLKQSYMSYIVREYLFGVRKSDRIILDISKLTETSFEDYIITTVTKYYGKTQAELIEEFDLHNSATAKNIRSIIVNRMFSVKNINNIEEFKKAGIKPKTIKVEKSGRIEESMSFPTFKFLELVEEEWETSTLKNMFDETKFLFIVFKYNDENELVFQKIKFWNIPSEDLEEVRKVWQKTVNTIIQGVEFIPTNRGLSSNLPKQRESKISHVRPHGINANDKLPLPDGRMMTKQCFWLNNSYIAEQIEKQ